MSSDSTQYQQSFPECWTVFDKRTDRRCTNVSFPSKELADQQIAQWVERDKRGKRQDVHDLIPHMEARRVW
jgi:hypothetical protein